MIKELIDKQDGFEIVRDQIAGILTIEEENQRLLAFQAGYDSSLWLYKVYTERSNPWERWLNETTDRTPIVNIWFDNANYDIKASNKIERQKSDGIFNIDIYAIGISNNEPNGHMTSDHDASLNLHRIIRLVRNILMAGEYTYLGLRGLVWSRWIESVNIYQPQLDGQSIQKIIAGRIVLKAEFNEFSPQVSSETLEQIAIQVKRAEDGQIYLNADYDYTL